MINGYRWTPRWILRVMVLCALGLSPQGFAQQESQSPVQQEPQSPAPTAPEGPAKPGEPSGTQKPPTTPDPNKPQNDRLFFAFPNYLTVEGSSSLPALTTKQKFKIQALGTFDPVELTYIAVAAGINQASNSEASYGQGFAGYAKRYGTSFADTMIGNFMTGAVFPSLLHQDPRYYQLGKGGFVHRTGHAVSRILVTRSDSGKREFNFSEILGNGVAAGIANAYHPAPRTLPNSVSIWWTQIGWDAAAYEMKEFWPDMHRFVRKMKH